RPKEPFHSADLDELRVLLLLVGLRLVPQRRDDRPNVVVVGLVRSETFIRSGVHEALQQERWGRVRSRALRKVALLPHLVSESLENASNSLEPMAGVMFVPELA